MERHDEIKGKALRFLLLLWVLWFLNMGARTLFSPILPLIEDEFMVRHARASSIFMFLAIGYATSVFFAGFYAGRFGYKRSIVLQLIVSSVVLFLTSFVKHFSAFYLSSFILGFAIGSYLPAVIPLITRHFAESNWGKPIVIHDSAAPVSIFCTPLIIVFILQFFTWRGVFVAFAVAFLIITFIFQWITDEVKVTSSASIRMRSLLRAPSFWALIIVWILTVGDNLGLYLIVPLYLTKELSMSIAQANSILGASRLGGIGVALLCGFLVDRFSLRKMMFWMILLSGMFTLLTGIAPVRLMGFSLFLQAIFVTGIFPVGFVIVAKMFKELTGVATGILLSFGVIFGSGLVPYLLGVSGDLLSFRFGISVLGILVCLSSLLILPLKQIQ